VEERTKEKRVKRGGRK
jgi:hypothetical protein